MPSTPHVCGVRLRHRTGCGKTLAFVLPAAELLAQDKSKARGPGRPPRAIVLVPTRELAKQVEADFAHVGAALNLSTACLYGGASYGSQESQLRRGVDVIVGTPGRVKDHLERGTLRLDSLRWVLFAPRLHGGWGSQDSALWFFPRHLLLRSYMSVGWFPGKYMYKLYK